MKSYVVRDITTGEIIKTGRCQDKDVLLQAGAGEVSEENTTGVQDDTSFYDITLSEYIDKSVYAISLDKLSIQSDGIDTATFTGVPEGTRVLSRQSGSLLIDDGSLSYRSDIPGVAKFKFLNPKYKAVSLTVQVV